MAFVARDFGGVPTADVPVPDLCQMSLMIFASVGGDLIHDFRGPTKDYILSELERRKDELRTKLVWIGAQKEPGFTSRIWKWVNGNVQLQRVFLNLFGIEWPWRQPRMQ